MIPWFKKLILVVFLALTACAPTVQPTPERIPVEVKVTPAPQSPEDPIGYYGHYYTEHYSINKCSGLPDWASYEGVTVTTVITTEDKSFVWHEGNKFVLHYVVDSVEVQINDRLVKYPGLRVVQLIPNKNSNYSDAKQVQELSPKPYQDRALEIAGKDPKFSVTVTYEWKIVNDAGQYSWDDTCKVDQTKKEE